jgi:tetratricopeptide (TPR) repeat protein
MSRSLRRLSGALVLTAAPSALLLAQAKPAAGAASAASTCDIDQNKPGSLGLAVLSITRVQASTDTAAKHKALRDVIGRVSADANATKQNPVGQAYTLAQAGMLLAQDVRLANAATRADLGLAGNPTEPADLLRLVDSTVSVVEAAKPGCAAQTTQLREFAWGQTVNAALQALNAQKADTAARLAERSLVVYKGSPLPYYVLASTAQQRGDAAAAGRYWPRVAELAASDTSAQGRELRSAALANMAQNAMTAAGSASAADKPARAREAVAAIRAALAAAPAGADATRLQGALAQMLTLSGDKAALGSVYADQLANPSKYDDLALTNAGVIASQANATADAARLFEAALQNNPSQRDALNNLAASYLSLKRFADVIPVARRLMAIDPANPDNPLFVAFGYQGLLNAAKAPAQKKVYADSLLKYNALSQGMPLKVSFTEFTRGDARAVLGMTVEGLKPQGGAAARAARPGARAGAGAAAAAGPRTYAFTFEFLDRSGAVVDTQQVSVGPVAAGQSKAQRVESAKAGVVAFRYKLAS